MRKIHPTSLGMTNPQSNATNVRPADAQIVEPVNLAMDCATRNVMTESSCGDPFMRRHTWILPNTRAESVESSVLSNTSPESIRLYSDQLENQVDQLGVSNTRLITVVCDYRDSPVYVS